MQNNSFCSATKLLFLFSCHREIRNGLLSMTVTYVHPWPFSVEVFRSPPTLAGGTKPFRYPPLYAQCYERWRANPSVVSPSMRSIGALARVDIHRRRIPRVVPFVHFVRPSPNVYNWGALLFVRAGSVGQCNNATVSRASVRTNCYTTNWNTEQKQERRKERRNKGSTWLHLLWSSFFLRCV